MYYADGRGSGGHHYARPRSSQTDRHHPNWGHPDHDALWAKATELDVPIAIHPTYEPHAILPSRFSFTGWSREAQWYLNVLVRQGVQQAFLTFFALGTLERFPYLKLGVLESGSGWRKSF